MKTLIYILLLFISINLNAQSWNTVGAGVIGDVFTEAAYNGKLYVGGDFLSAGGVACNKIATWDGSNWDSVPNSPGTTLLTTMEVFNNELYVGRSASPYIHRWTGSNWTIASVGLNNIAKDMVVFNSELYVGGAFTIAGGNLISRIAKWNGSIWSAVGAGFNNDVNALAIYNGELYAAGSFTGSHNRIAKWDGTAWVSLSTGITGGVVNAMTVYNNELYVAGDFTTAGGITANYIARWNGTNWNAVGSGIASGGGINTLLVYYNELYAGGLWTPQGITANNIASWNGSAWTLLGNGLDNSAFALCEFNNGLYVGGVFTSAGSVAANKIARWNVAAGIDDPKNENEIKVFPVPASDNLNISINDNIAATFVLHDITSRIVLKKEINGSATIDIDKLTRGIYLFEIRDKGTVLKKGKVVKE